MERIANGLTNGQTIGWTMFCSYTNTLGASVNDNFPTDFAFFTKVETTGSSVTTATNRRYIAHTVVNPLDSGTRYNCRIS